MNSLSDYEIGEVVIYHTKEYNCDTRDYFPVKKMATIKKIQESGITIELERGQNPDYNMHVGCLCLDHLEKIGSNKVIPLQKRARKLEPV